MNNDYVESTIHLSLRGGTCFQQQRKRLTRKEKRCIFWKM